MLALNIFQPKHLWATVDIKLVLEEIMALSTLIPVPYFCVEEVQTFYQDKNTS